MAQFKFTWMNDGKEFTVPELTIGDIKQTKKDSLELVREYKDIRGDKILDDYIEQETAFGLVNRILKKVNPSLVDKDIDDNLSISDLNRFTEVLFSVNKEVLEKAGINLASPRKPPSRT